MLFNSLEFLLFLPIVFCLYWFIFNKNLIIQNALILVSSYVFYGWWDWRFLSLIALSTIIDYLVGIKIEESDEDKKRKIYLWISILFNLIILGFFKYYNFFIDSWIDFLASFSYTIKSTWTLKVVLPVGISFYTFQTMSYSLDIYYNKLKPTKDFISFASFVSFFPQLVAGPIERASNLLPQILSKRKFRFEQFVQGLRLILWGMFKKVVIADSLAPIVDGIFNNYTQYNGGMLMLGLFYFSFQIYCDFSGYSDIAIGTAKLFGIELMSNFKFPYFSRNIGEFWRRWHISLSSWFRDYMYIPLGGSKAGKLLSLRNIFVIFIISGFWHGANLTFIVWGLMHAVMYAPIFFLGKNRQYTKDVVAQDKLLPTIKELYQMITTFTFTMITWVFFRSDTLTDALNYLTLMVSNILSKGYFDLKGFLYIIPILILDWITRKDERQLNSKIINIYASIIIFWLIVFHSFEGNELSFIYFQF